MDKMQGTDIKMDVTVLNRDGKRNYFKGVQAAELVKVQIAVSQGDGFILNDDVELIAYAPGTVLRVGLTESKETKEDK